MIPGVVYPAGISALVALYLACCRECCYDVVVVWTLVYEIGSWSIACDGCDTSLARSVVLIPAVGIPIITARLACQTGPGVRRWGPVCGGGTAGIILDW